MKIRMGFVSNSSSASFTIPIKALSAIQMEAIKQHGELGELFGISFASDAWEIRIDDNTILLDTSMDNFDMHRFLSLIGLDPDVYEHEDNGHWQTVFGESQSTDISVEELFKHFVRKIPFDQIEKMAKESDKARALLADPNVELDNED